MLLRVEVLRKIILLNYNFNKVIKESIKIMKKHKRILPLALGIALSTGILTGCSLLDSSNEEVKDKQPKKEQQVEQNKSELDITKSINDIKITPTKISNYKKREPVERKPPKHVTSVDITVKNISSVEKGIGSLDFIAYDKKGKKINHYGYADSLGDVVGINKTYKGKLYYVVSKEELKKIEFIDPSTEKKVTWSFK